MITLNIYDKINDKEFQKVYYDLDTAVNMMRKIRYSKKLILLSWSTTDNEMFEYLVRHHY